MTDAQLHLLAVVCPRCGRDLAAIAHRARIGLDAMHLALPRELTEGVRALDACLSGTCKPRETE